MGDVYVSLALIAAGVLVTLTGHSIFDPLIAGGIAIRIRRRIRGFTLQLLCFRIAAISR
jgi:Co/Zn/Cd efflux system component